jgi:hypothetical protein
MIEIHTQDMTFQGKDIEMNKFRTSWTSGRSSMWFSLLVVFLLALGLTVAVTAQDTPPTLTTDKADYAPGEVVHITGTGFAASTAYAIPVMRPDGSIVTIDPVTHVATPGWDIRTTDTSGIFFYYYQFYCIVVEYVV